MGARREAISMPCLVILCDNSCQICDILSLLIDKWGVRQDQGCEGAIFGGVSEIQLLRQRFYC